MQTPLQMNALAATVQDVFKKHELMLSEGLTPSQRSRMSAFVQGESYETNGAPSSEIFGILKQMKETFETNLAASQKEERGSIKAFEDLKAAKEAEIKAGNDQADVKSDQLAENNDQISQAKRDKKDTQNSLDADQKFLDDTTTNYASEKIEYAARVKTRSEELEAVTKAESILNSDENHDLMGKSLGFVQTDMMSARRAQAAKVLSAMAQKVQNPRLSAVAVSVRLDAFVKVKAAIDVMIVELGVEKKDEIKLKDFCRQELYENTAEITAAKVKMNDDTTLRVKLTSDIKKLNEAIAALEKEIAELQSNLKKAGEERDKQRSEFETTVADQRATQKVLASALKVLNSFYADKGGMTEALVQVPAGGDNYKPSGAAGKVQAMITNIINDAKAMEAETRRDEAVAEKEFAALTKETESTIAMKNTSIDNKKDTKADKKAALVADKKELEGDQMDLFQLGNTKMTLHQDCDFTMKNFEVRQSARDQEVEALKQAKSILSGSKFEAFLQGN